MIDSPIRGHGLSCPKPGCTATLIVQKEGDVVRAAVCPECGTRLTIDDGVARPAPEEKARRCGSCKECCTALGVLEIGKAPRTRCQHLCSSGCGIYATRPGACRSFMCTWVANPDFLHSRDRPDRLGVMFTTEDAVSEEAERRGIKGQVIVARELRKDAFVDQRVVSVFHAIKKAGVHVVRMTLGKTDSGTLESPTVAPPA